MYRIRIPLGLAFLSILAGIFYVEQSQNIVYPSQILTATMILAALWELYRMLENKGWQPYKQLGMCTAAIGLIAVIYDSNRHFDAILEEQFMVFAFAFSISLLSLLKTPEDDAVLEKMSSTVFGFVYVYMPFVYIILIRGLGIHSEDGIIYLLFVVLVAKSTDIGGYMVGYAFGKHKLCPSISPKKSWEGFAGGILLSIAVAFILRWQIGLLGETVSVLHTLLFASIVSLLSLLGDLSESLVKRKCDVKDSGNLIPEFGGILDMLDSFIFVAPFSFYYLKAIL